MKFGNFIPIPVMEKNIMICLEIKFYEPNVIQVFPWAGQCLVFL